MNNEKTSHYHGLDAYFSPGLCRLSDLARIGGHFAPTEILKESRTYVLMCGRLSIGGKEYGAVVKAFSNGKPVVLFDVLGADAAEARENLKSVMNIYVNAKSYNVNGIRDSLRRRLLCRILYCITSFLTVSTAFICALCFFDSKQSDFSYLFAMILSMLCFLVARIYYLNERDREEFRR